ncbi:hypothetical protein BBK36DRAFT_1141135 [Trichoderma citrinoviride]|uniref:Uncharacterized protein n=1 Tax=Trichoderma citrinoviride TaxID=58853 RepID=A0A2T4BAD7_9HYPO|nr:hypothetical protein BBK36DRAFT_1141135 [Trichoderma citrinoviride]PTB66276.1 hypothetical protein BBK36DRAFT_1141135 [Trichoderma citrinoviride]
MSVAVPGCIGNPTGALLRSEPGTAKPPSSSDGTYNGSADTNSRKRAKPSCPRHSPPAVAEHWPLSTALGGLAAIVTAPGMAISGLGAALLCSGASMARSSDPG